MSFPLRLSMMVAPLGGAAGMLGSMLGLGMPGDHDVVAQSSAFGETMERVYTKYASLPVGETALSEAGWTKHTGGCDPHLGFAWTQDSRGTTKSKPLVLYTTVDGQPAGVGTIFRKSFPAAQQKWVTETPLVQFWGWGTVIQIDVAFRSAGVCTPGVSHSQIGDTLIVNPAGANSKVIPLSLEAPWVSGSCFDGMGTHAFLNTNDQAGPMPWSANDLFPVVAMYHEGKINSIFFASTTNQVTIPIISANWWEPVSLSNDAMCGNWCDQSCGFTDHDDVWSTMHIYFNAHETVECAAELTCATDFFPFPGKRSCCPGDVSSQEAIEDVNRILIFVMGSLLGACVAASFALRWRSPGAREVQGTEIATAA